MCNYCAFIFFEGVKICGLLRVISIIKYTEVMNLIFNPTAFKHGVTESDIEYAMASPLVDRMMEKYINKYMVIGFDLKGKLLEVMYNLVNEDTANVFLAMKCRKEMYKYLTRSI